MERGGLYIEKEARVGGFWGLLDRTIAIVRLWSEGEVRGLREGLVGCVETMGCRREEGERPGNGFRRPKTPDEYTDYIAVIYLTVGQSNELRMR